MSEHLEKARGALAEASEMGVEHGQKVLPDRYKDLLSIASLQAAMAQADALTRIADVLEDAAKSGGSLQALGRIADALEAANRRNSYVPTGPR